MLNPVENCRTPAVRGVVGLSESARIVRALVTCNRLWNAPSFLSLNSSEEDSCNYGHLWIQEILEIRIREGV